MFPVGCDYGWSIFGPWWLSWFFFGVFGHFGSLEMKLTVKAILMLFRTSAAGFLLWPLTGGFCQHGRRHFFVYCFRSIRLQSSPGIRIVWFVAHRSIWSRNVGNAIGTVSVLSFLAVLFHSTTAEILPLFAFVVLVNIFSGLC
jgi:hypothetical protein